RERVAVDVARDVHRALAAAVLRIAERVALHALEVRQHVVDAPPRVAQALPGVVLERIAAHPDHAVHHARAAQRAPTRPEDLAPADFLVALGVKAPDRALAGQDVGDARRDPDPDPAVVLARLEEQHPVPARGREPIGQDAARRAGADDDEVVFSAVRCHFPSYSFTD